MTTKPKMIKHDGYYSVTCPHHLDIVTCPECDIFKNGVKTKNLTPWYKRLIRRFKHDQP